MEARRTAPVSPTSDVCDVASLAVRIDMRPLPVMHALSRMMRLQATYVAVGERMTTFYVYER